MIHGWLLSFITLTISFHWLLSSTVSGKNWAVNCIVVPQFGVSFSLAALKTFYLCLTMIYGVEKTLESPLDYKEIQPVHPKGDQSWVFIGRTDAEAETPILWPPHGKSWLIGKDPDAGRDWGQEEKGTTEDEMAGWHHRLNGPEFEWTPGVGDGQAGLACCDSWGHKEWDIDWVTELNWTERFIYELRTFVNYIAV